MASSSVPPSSPISRIVNTANADRSTSASADEVEVDQLMRSDGDNEEEVDQLLNMDERWDGDRNEMDFDINQGAAAAGQEDLGETREQNESEEEAEQDEWKEDENESDGQGDDEGDDADNNQTLPSPGSRVKKSSRSSYTAHKSTAGAVSSHTLAKSSHKSKSVTAAQRQNSNSNPAAGAKVLAQKGKARTESTLEANADVDDEEESSEESKGKGGRPSRKVIEAAHAIKQQYDDSLLALSKSSGKSLTVLHSVIGDVVNSNRKVNVWNAYQVWAAHRDGNVGDPVEDRDDNDQTDDDQTDNNQTDNNQTDNVKNDDDKKAYTVRIRDKYNSSS